MYDNLIRHGSTIGLAALALVALVFVQPPTRAAGPETASAGQNDQEVVALYSSSPVGIARGQTLRASFGLQQEREAPVEVRASARLFDAQGNVIAQGAEVQIPAQGLRTFDFDRDALAQPGEAGTGRLQVRMGLEVHGTGSGPGKVIMRDLDPSLEVFDTISGETQVHFGAIPIPNVSRTFTDIPLTNAFHAGLVPGQTLRISVLNPNEAEPPGQSRGSVLTQVALFDADGNMIAQSEEVAVAPGTFHSFDFDRDDLPLAGEPGTGRLQVRLEGKYLTLRPRPQDVLVSLELIANDTGRTTAQNNLKQIGLATISHADTH